MKIINDFIKLIIWMVGMTFVQFFIEFWIISQRFNLYSVITGLLLFITIAYCSYKGLKSL
jgi:hypothetical protein